jgi:hypothetical protein
MSEILTPRCPLCDQPPALALPGFTQWWCGNDDCTILCWNPSLTLDENLLDTGFVKLPPMEDGSDDDR